MICRLHHSEALRKVKEHEELIQLRKDLETVCQGLDSSVAPSHLYTRLRSTARNNGSDRELSGNADSIVLAAFLHQRKVPGIGMAACRCG